MHSRTPTPPSHKGGKSEGPSSGELIRQEEKSYEQAREEDGRAGRATATRSGIPAEAGWPAGPAVAEAGRSARAQADHVADAARTGPLKLRPSTRAAPHRDGGALFFICGTPRAASLHRRRLGGRLVGGALKTVG